MSFFAAGIGQSRQLARHFSLHFNSSLRIITVQFKKIFWSLAAAVPLFACVSAARADSSAAPVAAQVSSPYVGSYYLSGVREVGAQLRLAADGRFAFALSYGAVDQMAQGHWSAKGKVVTLTTDPTPPASLKLGEISSELAGPYADKSDKPTSLVVQVTSPRLGMVWSNMEVTGEFSNGLKRSGTTGNNGMLGFMDRTDGEWRGAVIKRVRVAYPKAKADSGWIDVDAAKAKTVTVHFEPGPMAPPAFETMQLEVRSESGGAIALVSKSDDGSGPEGWTFRK